MIKINFFLNVEDLISELSLRWSEHPDSEYNINAFTKTKYSGDNLMCCCPFHSETSPSFGVYTQAPYYWNCFVCGGGDLEKLVSHVLRIHPSNVRSYLLKTFYEASNRKKLDMLSMLEKGTTNEQRNIHLDLSTRHPYMYERGFTERSITKYELSYDAAGGFVIFPVRDSTGQIRFLKRRSVDRKIFLNEKNIHKKDVLYGLYYLIAAHNTKEIYITESETDTISCYQRGLPSASVLGRFLFKEQVAELLRAGVEVVNLFFDNDTWGLKATMQAYKLLKHTPIRINKVIYPEKNLGIDTLDQRSIRFKDANDLLQFRLLDQIKVMPFEQFVLQNKLIGKE